MPAIARKDRRDDLQAGVPFEIAHGTRRAALFQIRRRRAQHAMHFAEPLRNEAGVGQFGRAQLQRHVVAFVDDVGHVLRQRQFHRDRRITLSIANDRRHDVRLPETRRRVHVQSPRRLCLRVGRLGFGFVDIRENPLATVEVALACVRQRNAAGAAIQQTRAQMRFQLRDRARCVGRRNVQPLGGARKATLLRDPDKNAHHL